MQKTYLGMSALAVLGFTLACSGGGGSATAPSVGAVDDSARATKFAIEDSFWLEDDSRLWLRADGTILGSGDTNPEPDTWTRSGDTVTLSKNGGYAVFTMKLIGDHTMQGTATNEAGKTWHARASRVAPGSERAPNPSSFPLTNSRWATYKNTSTKVSAHFTFRGDGTFHATGNTNSDPETWSQDGDSVRLGINNDYVVYEGKLTSDHTMILEGKNEKGESWGLRAYRVLSPAEFACSWAGGDFDAAGSQWTVFKNHSTRASSTIVFLDDGNFLNSKDNNDEPDTWSQDGDTISWSANQYANYSGKLVGDHTIYASVTNSAGDAWQVRAERLPSPAELICPR